jgi:flagellar hook-associated protein 1 FlgK
MGLVNGALQIGQGALLSYQSALQVIGNNIANGGTDGYVRQTPLLTALRGVPLAGGLMPGGGVALTALQRNLDEAVESRLRAAIGDEQMNLAERQALTQLEALYNELGDQGLSSLLNDFFAAFQGVQNTPADLPTRGIAISAGQTLAEQLQQTRKDLLGMYSQLNQQIQTLTGRANDLASQVADLNREIVRAEAGNPGAAAALRDQRDGVLKRLAEVIDIATIETPQGAVNVYVGNQPLVQLTKSRGLTAAIQTDTYGSTVSVRFADTNETLSLTTGQIVGLTAVRDVHLTGQIQQIDTLAAKLIEQVNRLHSQGQGLDILTDLTGSSRVDDPTAALNSNAAGLPFEPVNGTFKMTVGQITKDPATGKDVMTDKLEYVIPVSLMGVGADMSLQDLVHYINTNVSDVTASVTPDNRLRLQASSGCGFSFSEDTSGGLAALGMNVFFTGSNASNIGVESNLAANPGRLAAGLSGAEGDGSNAGRIAALATASVPGLGNSIPGYWQATVAHLASSSAAAQNASLATHGVAQSLLAQRESVSGVNTDEEAVNLMRYQRSFQAAARYVSIVDELVNEMLSMVR